MLIADDQVAARENTARALRDTGYRVIMAVDGQEAVDKATAEKPDLVILDVVMPRLGGLDACRAIKKNADREGEFIPVMFLSSRGDPSVRIEGLRAGAQDFLTKPFDLEELRARIEALLRIKRIVDEARRVRTEFDESALHDRLTGLYNQRYLTQRLDEEFQRAQRYNEPLSVLALDLDEFEKVNGRFGRGVGDRLLAECARSLSRACRQVDVVTRAGGDEFVIVLPSTYFGGSLMMAERLWRDVKNTVVEEGASRVTCEVSVGGACFPTRDVMGAKDLLRFAHAALARAKAEGRGKICLFQHQGYLFQPQ